MGPGNTEASGKLAIVWSSGDPGVAMNMVFMYAKNSMLRGWWSQVDLVVWGPSAELLATDEKLQAELQELEKAGVGLYACKACADRLGVSDKLVGLGVNVMYMGIPLTEYLKGDWSTITF